MLFRLCSYHHAQELILIAPLIEYLRQPCVEQAFYNNPVKLIQGEIYSGGQQVYPSLCGDPRLPVATPMCCHSEWQATSELGTIPCTAYQGERMTYASAQNSCAAIGQENCQPGYMREHVSGFCSYGAKDRSFRSWGSVGCTLKAKISLESGNVAIVHSPEADFSGQTLVEPMVDQDTLNYFKVSWTTGYPSLNDCLANPSCTIHTDDSCICTVDETSAQVFVSATEVSSIDDLMNSLHIGAVDPEAFDAGTYTSLGDCGIQDVLVHSTSSSDCLSLNEDTIFAFVLKSKQFFLKNSKSVVSITGSTFSFRNPVQHNSLADPETRDMYHETDSVLDTLFYHPSHPPFLATRLAQRLGMSNPSPSYIARAVAAYSSGSFGGIGSGSYGDLAALTAALLLDHEARSTVLDQDMTREYETPFLVFPCYSKYN